MDGMRENDSIDGRKHDHDAHEASVHADDHSESHAEDSTVHEYTLDLAAVRAKLREKSGKQYWRTLEELAGDPHFEDLLHREFPRQASEWDETVDRRNFLKLAAASLALAGIDGGASGAALQHFARRSGCVCVGESQEGAGGAGRQKI